MGREAGVTGSAQRAPSRQKSHCLVFLERGLKGKLYLCGCIVMAKEEARAADPAWAGSAHVCTDPPLCSGPRQQAAFFPHLSDVLHGHVPNAQCQKMKRLWIR